MNKYNVDFDSLLNKENAIYKESGDLYLKLDAESENLVENAKDGLVWIGQIKDSNENETIAYFENKTKEFIASLKLFVQKINHNTKYGVLEKSFNNFKKQIKNPSVLIKIKLANDILESLIPDLESIKEEQVKAKEELAKKAIQIKQNIIFDFQNMLSDAKKGKVIFKDAYKKIDEFIEKWKASSNEIRLSQGINKKLWKEFSDIRKEFSKLKKEFFKHKEELSKEAEIKQKNIIEEAKQILKQDNPLFSEYLKLKKSWQQISKGSKTNNNELWLEFNEIGNKITEKLDEIDKKNEPQYLENLSKKEALLKEAEEILKLDNLKQIAQAFASIQTRWEKIGKVTKDKTKEIESKLNNFAKEIEKKRKEFWDKTDISKTSRQNSFKDQLNKKIEDLEKQVSSCGSDTEKQKLQELLDKQKELLKVFEEK